MVLLGNIAIKLKLRSHLKDLAKELVIPQTRGQLRLTTNLRSTVLVAMERCEGEREENVRTVLEIPVTKPKRYRYCPLKKIVKVPWYARNVTKTCVSNIVLSFVTIVRKMLSHLLTSVRNFSACLPPE